MRSGIRTLTRTISALAVVFMLVAGASLDAWAQGRGRGNDRGRHSGWERGRHRGWERSRSRHVRNDDWRENRRGRRLARRERRRDRREYRREHRRDRREYRRDVRSQRRNRADLNGDGRVSSHERRVLASRLRRGY